MVVSVDDGSKFGDDGVHFTSGNASTVPKCRWRLVVIKNGILLANIRSIAIVTFLCN